MKKIKFFFLSMPEKVQISSVSILDQNCSVQNVCKIFKSPIENEEHFHLKWHVIVGYEWNLKLVLESQKCTSFKCGTTTQPSFLSQANSFTFPLELCEFKAFDTFQLWIQRQNCATPGLAWEILGRKQLLAWNKYNSELGSRSADLLI